MKKGLQNHIGGSKHIMQHNLLERNESLLNPCNYCQWKGNIWGPWWWWFPCDPSDPMLNIPEDWWTLCASSLDPWETWTESIGSILLLLLFPWRPRRWWCMRDIEPGCCIMCLKPNSDVCCCVCGDDRRERAQSESGWIRVVVNLSQNILLFADAAAPEEAVSDIEMVFRRGWQTEAPWVWLLLLLLWKSVNCCLLPPPLL